MRSGAVGPSRERSPRAVPARKQEKKGQSGEHERPRRAFLRAPRPAAGTGREAEVPQARPKSHEEYWTCQGRSRPALFHLIDDARGFPVGTGVDRETSRAPGGRRNERSVVATSSGIADEARGDDAAHEFRESRAQPALPGRWPWALPSRTSSAGSCRRGPRPSPRLRALSSYMFLSAAMSSDSDPFPKPGRRRASEIPTLKVRRRRQHRRLHRVLEAVGNWRACS
jgi:hypothetical protein